MCVTILIHGKNQRIGINYINYKENANLFYIFRSITRWENKYNIKADEIYESSDSTFFSYNELSNEALLDIKSKHDSNEEFQLIIES